MKNRRRATRGTRLAATVMASATLLAGCASEGPKSPSSEIVSWDGVTLNLGDLTVGTLFEVGSWTASVQVVNGQIAAGSMIPYIPSDDFDLPDPKGKRWIEA